MSIDLKDTFLLNMPDHWEVSRIKKIAKCTVGIATSTTHAYCDDGVLLLRNQNIKNGKIALDDVLYIKPEFDLQNKSKRLKAGDIITVRTGYPGVSAVVPKELEGSQSFTTLIIRLNDADISSEFLCYYINSENGKRFFKDNQAGGGQQNVGSKTLENMTIPLPPLPEQQKIAEILSTVDAKIEIIDQQISETSALKKGLMQQLLSGKLSVVKNRLLSEAEMKDSVLGRIPESWEVVKIQDLLDKKRIISHLDGNHGGLYPKANEFITEGVPYIGANSFVNGKVDFSKCKYLSEERSLKFKKGVAKNGDVLFAHNATVGPVAFLETELDFVILSTTATYYRLDNKTIDAKYWLCFLSSPKFRNQYEKVMGQSTRNQVPITMQRSFSSVIPSFKEQKKISEILSSVDDKLQVLSEKKVTYQELKQGLMQQLLTGKVRVKV
ncbi:MAG TPA: restriction endonuclease subunit S [Brumimicrobium sp.]|nr:restriction endonuclease subunit S [Brumimicrobium sp.]